MLRVALRKRLPNLDLDMRFDLASDVLVLFGASGAGKSLTLKMIAGVERPDGGLIQMNDRVLFDASAGVNLPPQARRVGYVPQHYALFPHLTAEANISLPLRRGLRWPATKARDRAQELLALVGLSGRANTYPGELSGGQQQRVALARALAIEPDVLLLDEPFAALDAPIRAELRAEFRSIQQAMRVPTIFVTHDLEEAVAVSRQIAIVVDGGIRQIGIAREVLDHPNDARVAELTQARNLIRGRIHQSERGSIADTPMGEIPLPAAERSLTDGTSVIVVIRPEVFRVAPPSDAVDGDLAFSGSVTGVIDLGTRAIVSVQVAAATVEVALSPSDVHRYELTEGGPVRLTVQHRDLHVIAVDAPNDSWKL